MRLTTPPPTHFYIVRASKLTIDKI